MAINIFHYLILSLMDLQKLLINTVPYFQSLKIFFIKYVHINMQNVTMDTKQLIKIKSIYPCKILNIIYLDNDESGNNYRV